MFRILLTAAVLFLTLNLVLGQSSSAEKDQNASGFITQAKSNTEILLDSISPGDLRYRHTLDSSKHSLIAEIDSLKFHGFAFTKQQRCLDSLNKINPIDKLRNTGNDVQANKLIVSENKLREKLQKESAAVSDKMNEYSSGLNSGIDRNSAVPSVELTDNNKVTQALSSEKSALQNVIPGSASLLSNDPAAELGLKTTTTALSLPEPATGLPSTVPDLSGSNEIGLLKGKGIGGLSNTSELKNAEKNLGELAPGFGPVLEVKNDIVDAAKDENTEQLSAKVENELKSTDALKELNGKNQPLDNLKEMSNDATNPDALKDKAVLEVKKAVNHFEGKEDVLRAATEKMQKISRRYSNFGSVKDLPKHIPNEMKGKPFSERVIPGISFQVVRINSRYRLDINPWIAYRLRGNITIGGGWNERVFSHNFAFYTNQRTYGPRVFAEYKIKTGYWIHADLEAVNTVVPPNQIGSDGLSRQWIWNSFIGFKKRYRIYKSFYGNALLLYNVNSLFANQHVNLYGDPLMSRIGFEFPLNNKK